MVVSIGVVAVDPSALAPWARSACKCPSAAYGTSRATLLSRHNQASMEHRRLAHQSRRLDRQSQAEGWKLHWSRGEMQENDC